MSNNTKKFVFSKLSLQRLENVDPKLLKVVHLALSKSEIDFMVVEGLRNRERMMINYGKGRTAAQCITKGVPAKYAQPKLAKVTWLNNPFASNHADHDNDGDGEAVDLAPYPLDWNDIGKYKKIAEAMKTASKELKIPIIWGGDWTGKDYPHFELA